MNTFIIEHEVSEKLVSSFGHNAMKQGALYEVEKLCSASTQSLYEVEKFSVQLPLDSILENSTFRVCFILGYNYQEYGL